MKTPITKTPVPLNPIKGVPAYFSQTEEAREYAESLINTVREPLITLDQDLRVVSASRAFYKVFNVKPEETVGQLIYDLGNKQWDIPKLRELLETILPQKTTFDNYEVEHDFTTIGRRTMLLNARQIQRVLGKERIILLSIEDITERRKIEDGLEKARKELASTKISEDTAREYAESIINTVREPLISLDQDLRVVSASRAFYKVFSVNPKETVGKLIYDLGNKQWDIPKLRELLENILPQQATFDNYEVEHDFTTIGRRTMLLNARQIQRVLGKERVILLSIEDITERRKIEDGLEKARKELASTKISEDAAREYSDSIINTVREPLISLDQDLRVVSASRSFYEVFNVKPEETVGQLIYDLGNKQWDIPKLRELLETILPQKATFDNYEVEHDFTTIGRRTMLLNARQIQRASGKERIILLSIEDITARREIEDGLEKARKELAAIKISEDAAREYADSIVNTVREPLLALDQDLRVVTASRSFYDVFKAKPKETVGELIYDLGNKQWDIPKLRELLETILPQQATFDNYEVEHDFTTIGRRTMLLNARQIQRVLGKERIILLAIEDITERKEIENGLEEVRKELASTKISEDAAREYAESLINTVREPLISLDQDLRVVSASRAFYRVFNVKSEETVGQLIYDLGNKQWNIPKLRELLETILPQETTFDNYEVEHDFTDIGQRTMLLNARQIQRALGKERIILLSIEDITERKRLETELSRSRVELEKSLKELDSFAYSVSHDLKAPLRGIGQVVDWLHEELLDTLNDDQKENMGLMKARVGRMNDLIDGMLRSARLGRLGEVREMVNLQALLVDVIDSIQPPKEITVEIVGTLPTLSCVLVQIEQVFQNLISNAIRYMDKALGKIRIGCQENDLEWAFFVEDNGPGIPKEHFDRIFQIFQTLKPRDEVESTGIGLSIVKKVVELHHGRVWLESELGKGSTFFFSLPKTGQPPERQTP